METRNICKLISEAGAEHLSVKCFVHETKEDVMRAPYRLGEHRMILFEKGRGTVTADGKETAFGMGDLFFLFAGENAFLSPTEPTEYLYVSFEGAKAEALFRRFGITVFSRKREGFDRLLPFWRESLLHADGQNVDLAAESVLLYTFSRLSSVKNGAVDPTTEMIAFSEQHFGEPSLSLCVLAEALGYNAKYLSHLFKEKTGVGYAEYLRTLRIKHAVTLMDFGVQSVKNVALLSGFSDPLYFSTVFKKEMGVTPREYVSRKSGEE